MAPASELPPGGQHSGAGAALFGLIAWAALAAAACGDDDARPRAQPAAAPVASREAADPARGITTELDGATPAFGDGVLAELMGDDAGAREAFERVLDAPGTQPAVAARAALHLAQLEARSGKARRALDLVARAAGLAPSDVVIDQGLAQLRADIVAAAGAGDIRGPRLGTALPGVAPDVAAAFGAAERAMEAVMKLRPRPLIEALSGSILAKQEATEGVVARYRALGEHGGLVELAATYRIGSLYHDLAIGLLFDLPPELDPNRAAGLRRHLRARAVAYLKQAVTAYEACLATPPLPDAELWRLAAETDLRRARDALGEAATK